MLGFLLREIATNGKKMEIILTNGKKMDRIKKLNGCKNMEVDV